MNTLWIVLAFLLGVVVGGAGALQVSYRRAARRQDDSEGEDWFWQERRQEWRPYSE